MIVSIILAIVALSVLIFVHELFHFLVARISSISAPIFSIGFGPKLFSFEWKGTEFRISAIPFGGYVNMKGMEPDDIKGEEDEFYSKNRAIQSAVVFAGPFANFLLGFLIYFGTFWTVGIEVPDSTILGKNMPGSKLKAGDEIVQIEGKQIDNWYDITDNIEKGSRITLLRDGIEREIILDSIISDSLVPQFPPVAGEVDREGPAYNAGIRKGARIVRISGNDIEKWEDITEYISPALGETLELTYYYEGDTTTVSVVPEESKNIQGDSLVGRGIVGIVAPTKRIEVPPGRALRLGWQQTYYTGSMIFRVLSMLFRRKVSARNLAGPIGIVMVTRKFLGMGFVDFLFFFALISVNLGIVNLFPVPPLDGFHIVISIVTSIVRQKPSKKMLKVITAIGTFILFALMILVIINDIVRIFSGGM